MNISAQWAPQTVIFASFERGDSHESNDPKISSGGVDHAELRMILGRAFFPKMLIFDQFGFENGWFWKVGWPRIQARGGPISTPKRCKNRHFWTLFLKNVGVVTSSNVRSCFNQLRKNVGVDLQCFSPQRMPTGQVKQNSYLFGVPFSRSVLIVSVIWTQSERDTMSRKRDGRTDGRSSRGSPRNNDFVSNSYQLKNGPHHTHY